MLRFAAFLIALMSLVAVIDVGSQAQAGEAQSPPHPKFVAAAPGRIEGSADPVEIGSSTSGIIQEVPVEQGDKISVGQLLVRIDCNDIAAQLQQRIADRDATAALYRKLVNGPRQQEIDIAQADVELAEARLAEAQTRLTRSQSLVNLNDISRATFDTALRDSTMAAAQVDSARLRLRLLKAGTRVEELDEAKARMMSAERAVAVTTAELAKCEIKSPIDGVVLSKHVSVGELVSLFFPKPLLTIEELRHLRVRAEVDEHDVPVVRVGQKVEVVIDASPQHLTGTVTSLAPMMGRRKILTSDPADKSDRDVREVLIDIDGSPQSIPIGLRVSVLFL